MTITPETIAELRGLLAEAPPLPYRYHEKAYGDPSNGPEYVALEAQRDGRWEEVATAHYEKWGGMGLALSSAAVNALPALLDAAERLAEVTAERDALADAVARVRGLHVMHPDDCKCLQRMFGGECFHHGGCEACRYKFPCSTLAALDGSES